MKVTVRVYEKGQRRLVISFGEDMTKCLNGAVYVKVWAKAHRLYFLPAMKETGILISDKNKIQIGKKEKIDACLEFVGKHELLYDEATHYYYVAATEKEEAMDEQEEACEAPKPVSVEPKPLANMERPMKVDITVKAEKRVLDTLRDLMDECIDSDDLAGAKALLKAIRKVRKSGGNTAVA